MGVALNAWAGYPQDLGIWVDVGWKSSLAGLGVGFGVFFVAYLLGGMAEGDVKLMGMVGAFSGLRLTVLAILATSIAGGVMAVGLLLWKRRFFKTLGGMAQDAAATVGLAEKKKREKDQLPYGVAIAVGTAWVFWWTK